MLVGGLVVYIATTGLAVHFKLRADRLERHYREAAVEVEELRERLNAPRPQVTTPAARIVEVTRTGQVTEEDALLDRIAELERELSAREDAEASAQLDRRYTPPTDPSSEEPRERRDWMEEMRENDPDRYAEMMRRREEMRQRVQDSLARKASHFLYRDTSAMTDVEREEYQHMLGLLGETWNLHEQMQLEELSREDRNELRRAMGENLRELRPLLSAQRDREFYDLGLQLGYTEQNAAQFVDYINEMIDITSMNIWTRGGGGGSGRGGPGGGSTPGGR